MQGYLLFICHNSDRVDQIVVPKSGGFHELLIKELHVTPLAGHLGVQKLTHALFQRVWWPKLRETVTSFVYSCTTYMQTKDSTAVPPGLLSPFQFQNLASLRGALILPLIYHSLMDVTQFSLVWITSQNTQFSFLVRWVIRH